MIAKKNFLVIIATLIIGFQLTACQNVDLNYKSPNSPLYSPDLIPDAEDSAVISSDLIKSLRRGCVEILVQSRTQ